MIYFELHGNYCFNLYSWAKSLKLICPHSVSIEICDNLDRYIHLRTFIFWKNSEIAYSNGMFLFNQKLTEGVESSLPFYSLLQKVHIFQLSLLFFIIFKQFSLFMLIIEVLSAPVKFRSVDTNSYLFIYNVNLDSGQVLSSPIVENSIFKTIYPKILLKYFHIIPCK